jgi:hypothetical protein
VLFLVFVRNKKFLVFNSKARGREKMIEQGVDVICIEWFKNAPVPFLLNLLYNLSQEGKKFCCHGNML